MENIRLPEDFTDRVMQRIEVRERAAVRRASAAAVAGGILGGAFLIAAAVIILRHYNIDLSSFTEGFSRIDILDPPPAPSPALPSPSSSLPSPASCTTAAVPAMISAPL